MPDQMDLFMPLPQDSIERIHRLAHDLAWGAVNAVWHPRFTINFAAEEVHCIEPQMGGYFERMWSSQGASLQMQLHLLHAFGYLSSIQETTHDSFIETEWQLTEKAFNLLGKAPPVSIFISYRRSGSGALAMYIWSELRHEGFTPFLDIRSINPGEEWYEILKKRVMMSNVFIAVITNTTLESEYVRGEIRWALDTSGMRIIPIVHEGCTPEYVAQFFPELGNKNFIIVREETSAEIYGAVEQIKGVLWLLTGRKM